MTATALLLMVPFGLPGIGHGRLPSQHPYQYRHGCTPANRHCERCRGEGCGGECFDYRRNFDYPWYPPFHRPMPADIWDDFSPRIIPLEDIPLDVFPPGCPGGEELPPPSLTLPGTDESSPSDRPPRGK
jgi:hypothetical protein